MNVLDRAIASVFPGWAVARAVARARLDAMARHYEATTPTTDRKARRYSGSGNRAVESGAVSVREQMRHLERNNDIVRGGLSSLVRNTIGPEGIQVEPQPRDRDGNIHDDFAEVLRHAYAEFSERPEVTWRQDWPQGQRTLGRTWFRDGEVLAQELVGTVARLDHGKAIPYSLEFLEPDMVPLDFDVAAGDGVNGGTLQGVEMNEWGRPRGYRVYKRHPGDLRHTLRQPREADLKRVPAERMLHLAHRDRISQIRGVSPWASVIARLENLGDYEYSEQIAAKVAASMSAFIIKGTPELYDPSKAPKERREMSFTPGLVFDDLAIGESVGTIDTNRPNTNVAEHRAGQLRAAAAGIDVGGSTLSKDYRGTFSAMRQELVEQWAAYAILGADFSHGVVRPVYRRVVDLGSLAGVFAIPRDVDPATLYDAIYSPVAMPWIDPEKEANAWATLVQNGLASAVEIIRLRGRVPKDVVDQIARWQRMLREAGVQPMPAALPNPSSDQDTQETLENAAADAA